MRDLIATFCFALMPAFASAEGCPAAPDHDTEIEEVLGHIKAAGDAVEARALMNELWLLWTDAPDGHAQELLDRGMAQREGYDFLGARDTLDLLIEYCPDYAEGYNQRAFASFLRQDYDAALWDLDRTLDLMPNHMAALSGKALTLMGMGRDDEAQVILRQAVEMNPWLNERSLLRDPIGTDI